MLNEKVTISVCGSSYRLKTDNAKQLISDAGEVEKRISEYCRNIDYIEKADAAVFTSLDLMTEIHILSSECSRLELENKDLIRVAEQGAGAIEENASLRAANAELKKENDELAELRKKIEVLEQKNLLLTEDIKAEQERSAAAAKAEKEAEGLRKQLSSLEERNSRLVSEAKENASKLSESEKKINELTKDNA